MLALTESKLRVNKLLIGNGSCIIGEKNPKKYISKEDLLTIFFNPKMQKKKSIRIGIKVLIN